MDKKRILFWAVFIIILALIVWGLVAAMNKSGNAGSLTSAPAISAADHTIGNPNAKVTLIEYGDFQCPACGLYAPIVERLINEASSTMFFSFRHFPLPQHANAIPASLAAEAAGQQGQFWGMYKELYAGQNDWSTAVDPKPLFEKYAADLGLNLAKFRTDEGSSTLRDVITADADAGIKIGINQTPSFFVNGKMIQNPQSYDEFKSLIDSAASSSPQ